MLNVLPFKEVHIKITIQTYSVYYNKTKNYTTLSDFTRLQHNKKPHVNRLRVPPNQIDPSIQPQNTQKRMPAGINKKMGVLISKKGQPQAPTAVWLSG
jgi:hypothetical protein